jgi:hypothetical protein
MHLHISIRCISQECFAHMFSNSYVTCIKARNKFLILCYCIFNMISKDPGDIAKQGLVCDMCGELFDWLIFG